MEKVYEISLLLDFYGQLLTERQYETMDLHFNNDYSLGEISEQLSISRQGVYDNIKRGKEMMTQLEQKLGLVKKFTENNAVSQELLRLLKLIDRNDLKDKDKEVLDEVEKNILNMLSGED